MTDTTWHMPSESAVDADRRLFVAALDRMASRGVIVHGPTSEQDPFYDWGAHYDRYCRDDPPPSWTGVFWHADSEKETFEGESDYHHQPEGRTPLYLFWYGDLDLLCATLREVGIDIIGPRSPDEPLSLCFPSSTNWAMPY